jgi:hypothetical protein
LQIKVIATSCNKPEKILTYRLWGVKQTSKFATCKGVAWSVPNCDGEVTKVRIVQQ